MQVLRYLLPVIGADPQNDQKNVDRNGQVHSPLGERFQMAKSK